MIDRRETARTAKHARGGRLDGGARNMQEERARTGGADNGRPCNGAKEQRRTSAERLRFPLRHHHGRPGDRHDDVDGRVGGGERNNALARKSPIIEVEWTELEALRWEENT